MPKSTSTLFDLRYSIPLPDTRGLLSLQEIKTFLMPDFTINSAQGGVFP
jgi:hypothetical protein